VGTDAARAYVDAPIDDLDAATEAARAAARRWGLDEPVLLRRGMNAIFGCGDSVVRVASPTVPAETSLELAAYLTDRGIRVPASRRDDVVVADRLQVTAWERIDGSDTPVDWRAVGSMVRRVHELDPTDLPPSVPVPHPSVLPWWDFDTLLARADGAIDDVALAGLRSAVEEQRGWQSLGPAVVCHGDVHPGNVMMRRDGPVLIDWDLLCHAPAGWDHGPLLTWHDRWGGDASIYEHYAQGYGKSFGDDPAALAFAELRLVAATLMRVLAAIDDPAARPEADLRLRYWRSRQGSDPRRDRSVRVGWNVPDAPAWTAQ
jgi:Ser/Thr protein kinase RdoA (MazF antagonist)